MQDVEKTEIQRDEREGRNRRRSKQSPFYRLAIIISVIIVGYAICCTFLFNIGPVEIEEDTMYTVQEIMEAADIHTGDNLVRLDTDKVVSNIKKKCVCVETVTVKKHYPDTVTIYVTRGEAALNIVDESGALQVTTSGRIIESSAEYNADLPIVTGFQPKTRNAGDQLTSKAEGKDEVFLTLAKQVAKESEYPITAIDMTDRYNIVLTLDNRIEFNMGNVSNLEYKLELARTVMADLSAEKEGYMDMVGNNQISFRDKDAVAAQTTAVVTTALTDEYGAEVETDEDGNYITEESEETTTETTTETVG